MPKDLTRRELMRRSIAAGGLFAAGSLMPVSSTPANQAAGQSTTQPTTQAETRVPATVVDGKVVQPRRELSVLQKTSILVVGGGPAGTAAAFSAKRLGVDVTLVERYGYLGGSQPAASSWEYFRSTIGIRSRSSSASAKS